MMRATGRRGPWPCALYLGASLGMMCEAALRLPRAAKGGEEAFAAAWFAFAMVTAGANLWFALGADRESRRRRARENAAGPGGGARGPDERPSVRLTV